MARVGTGRAIGRPSLDVVLDRGRDGRSVGGGLRLGRTCGAELLERELRRYGN